MIPIQLCYSAGVSLFTFHSFAVLGRRIFSDWSAILYFSQLFLTQIVLLFSRRKKCVTKSGKRTTTQIRTFPWENSLIHAWKSNAVWDRNERSGSRYNFRSRIERLMHLRSYHLIGLRNSPTPSIFSAPKFGPCPNFIFKIFLQVNIRPTSLVKKSTSVQV